MMPAPYDDPESPFAWSDRILSASDKIARATTGALFAATGAAAVLGYFIGGLLWMPFGACVTSLVYRAIKHFEERDLRRVTRQIQIQGQIRLELEAIAASKLPPEQKELLAENLKQAASRVAAENKLLR